MHRGEAETKEGESGHNLKKRHHLMDQQVAFTVCVKVALTHYLVGKQSHLD